MDSTKRLVLDTEKEENKRIAIRFLKEVKLLKYWKDYIRTATYQRHCTAYKCGKMQTWYDTKECYDIFGLCDFTYYIQNTLRLPLKFHSIYEMFLCFLYILYPKKYESYGRERCILDFCKYIRNKESFGQFEYLIDKWLEIKKLKDEN